MLPISLTTIDSRQISCLKTLKNLLFEQTVKPSEIHLWLSKEPYLLDKGIEKINPNLETFICENPEVKVHWTKNIGPYRKLLPFTQMFQNSPVLVIDDDELHIPTFYETACKLWEEKQSCISFRASYFCPTNRYVENPLVFDVIDINLFHKGNGGVVYHSSWFQDLDFYKSDIFLNCCRTNDDIWFNLWRIKKQIPCYVTPNIFIKRSMTPSTTLWSTNETANDSMIKKTMETLKIIYVTPPL